MRHLRGTSQSAHLLSRALVALVLIGACAWSGLRSEAADQPNKRPFFQQNKPVAPPAPRSAMLTSEAWQNVPMTPVPPGEIDQLVAKELQQSKVDPAALTTDEQFIRRVTLDLTGELPLPADV